MQQKFDSLEEMVYDAAQKFGGIRVSNKEAGFEDEREYKILGEHEEGSIKIEISKHPEQEWLDGIGVVKINVTKLMERREKLMKENPGDDFDCLDCAFNLSDLKYLK